MSDKYKVETVTKEQADAFLRGIRQPENPFKRPSPVTTDGFELVGEFSLTARDVKSGEVEWEHSGKNLITDLGRRSWVFSRFNSMVIMFAPSIEVPQSGRYSVVSDASQCFESADLTPSVAPATHTKTFSTTFNTPPASNRTLGTIALSYDTGSAFADRGLIRVAAFALLTPAKTQTTTQTLEVVYKVSMNPIA